MINSQDNFNDEGEDAFISIPLDIKPKSLQNSLILFIQENEMKGDNQWVTSDNRYIDVKISNKIKYAPPILFFHLQRFSMDSNTGAKKKLNSVFEFPVGFNLSHFMILSDESNMYELAGIINHSGNAFADHYVSFVRISENQWKLFDDNKVYDIPKKTKLK